MPHVVRPPQGARPDELPVQRRPDLLGAHAGRLGAEPGEKGDGGTLFLSGTHKASFPYPPSVREPDNAFSESYSCPAGSVFIFTESLLHAGTPGRTGRGPGRDLQRL